jgi:putative transposase
VSGTGTRVVAILERLAESQGWPQGIAVDHGPECMSRVLDAWAHRHDGKLAFSRPGQPTAQPFMASFNGRFHEERLDLHWFAGLEEAQGTVEAWRVAYHTVRPHTAPGNQTPAAYRADWRPAKIGQTEGGSPFGRTKLWVQGTYSGVS